MFRMEGRRDFAVRNHTEEFSQVENYVCGGRTKKPSTLPLMSRLLLMKAKKKVTRLKSHWATIMFDGLPDTQAHHTVLGVT
jgi:hypothetical protein